MLLDYCIGKSVSSIEEFYLLPVGDKLIQYDTLAVNTIVKK
jgi:chloramphenicol O-acetyltransferase type A